MLISKATKLEKLHQPFPLGHPMAAIKLPALGTGLEVDRALTAAERRRLLDAADLLLAIGGRSKDRKRYKTGERPRRTGYRPYRNRAIIYTLTLQRHFWNIRS